MSREGHVHGLAVVVVVVVVVLSGSKVVGDWAEEGNGWQCFNFNFNDMGLEFGQSLVF